MWNRRLLVVVIILLPVAALSLAFNEDEVSQGSEINSSQEEEIKIRLKLTATEEIIYIPLEEYLIGVVAAEMPALFHEEALKAQAIASRSYVISRKNPDRDFDVVDTVNNQVFINEGAMRDKWQEDFDIHFARIKNSVQATAGKVLVYNERVISAHFFAMSNGYTEYVELVFSEPRNYLRSVESPWDNADLRNFRVEVSVVKREFCERLEIACSNLKVNGMSRSRSNRVNEIIINGVTFKGTDFRRRLDLRSTDFDIKIGGNTVYITTRGHGHGVGMSQHGANGMARAGRSYREILKHYYQNVKIKNLNDV